MTLRNYNEYVNDIKCIAIKGVSLESTWCKAPMEGNEEATIEDHFLLQDHGIKSLEKTQLTKEKGKWFLLYKLKTQGECKALLIASHLGCTMIMFLKSFKCQGIQLCPGPTAQPSPLGPTY
eukprot:2090319-Ditylum_brightwellii.AAC.1